MSTKVRSQQDPQNTRSKGYVDARCVVPTVSSRAAARERRAGDRDAPRHTQRGNVDTNVDAAGMTARATPVRYLVSWRCTGTSGARVAAASQAADGTLATEFLSKSSFTSSCYDE